MNSKLYPLFLNRIISNGKKRKAEKVLLECFYFLRNTWNVNPAETIELALENVSPAVRLQTRRRGSQRVRVPVPLNTLQRDAFGIRLLCAAARKDGRRSKSSISFRLAQELYNASKSRGNAFSNAQLINKDGINNQPNSHLRWFLKI